jgi:tetratricopeptide (TPR) repeat protein
MTVTQRQYNMWLKPSESDFWKKQSGFYTQDAKTVWSKTPHTVTNNRFLAQQYATLVQSILPAPTIIEIGAGIGEFAYHYCTNSQKPFKYWITDFDANCVEQLSNNHDFNPWRWAYVHFSTIDCEKFAPPEAVSSEPVVIILNYLLDSLAHDGYHKVTSNHIQTLLFPSDSRATNDADGQLVFSENDQIPYKLNKEPLDPRIEAYIKEHWEVSQSLTIPTGGIKLLETLRKTYPSAIVLITDKACYNPADGSYNEGFSFQREGAISCTVNMHAVKELFQPEQFLHTNPDSVFDLNISSCVMTWGLTTEAQESLNNAWGIIDANTIYDYALINRELALEKTQISYPLLKRWLVKHNYDPYLFLNMSDHLFQHALSGNIKLQEDIRGLLTETSKHHYSTNIRLVPAIASCYRAMSDFETAETVLRKYELSAPNDYFFFKEISSLLYAMKNKEESLSYAEKGLHQHPNCTYLTALKTEIMGNKS